MTRSNPKNIIMILE